MATGEYDHYVFCGAGLGIFDLYGKHFDAVAAVWDGEPVAGDDCAGGGDGVPDQHGEGGICVDYSGANVVRGDDYADGGGGFDQENFLGAEREERVPVSRRF